MSDDRPGESPGALPVRSGALAGYDDVPAIVERLRSLKAQMDSAVDELRGWWHLRGREESSPPGDAAPLTAVRDPEDPVGALARHLGDSLALIVRHTDQLLEDVADDATARRLATIRRVADDAAGTVRLLQASLTRRPRASIGE
jgi:hypothetical protein